MGCEEFRQLLDAYIDGELSPAEIEALSEHAKACEACREELKAAQLLRETLAHMDDGIEVPLQAQAAWRSAVRAEAKKNTKVRTRRWIRTCSAIAAALVLALGVSLTINDRPAPQAPLAAAKMANQAESAVVARDGAPVLAAYPGDAQADCTLRRKISVVSLADAMQKLDMLAAEYSGNLAVQNQDACIIELPADYLQDFMKALAGIGTELSSETFGEAGETATVHIQFIEE